MRKTFFKNNQLNKGCNNILQRDLSSSSAASGSKKEKLTSFLPDPSIMACYEEIYPGSTKILFDMAYKEQKKIHQINCEKIRLQNRALSLGKIFFFFILIINLFTFIMMYKISISVNNYIVVCFVFSVLIFLVTFFTFKDFQLTSRYKKNKKKNMKH